MLFRMLARKLTRLPESANYLRISGWHSIPWSAKYIIMRVNVIRQVPDLMT